MDLGYTQAPVNQDLYDDGWYRTFKGYPKFSQAILDMLHKYVEKEQYSRVMIYLIGKCEYDQDYAEFLLNELINKNL